MVKIAGKGEDLLTNQENLLMSPPSGAESLFIGGVFGNSDVPASLLAEQFQHKPNNLRGKIKKSGSFHTASMRGGSVGSTDDDFVTAGEISDSDSIASNDNFLNSHNAVPRSHVHVETTDDTTMSSMFAKKKAATVTKPPLPDVAPAPVTKPEPVPAPSDSSPPVSEDEKMMIDAAEIVYSKAKDILAWVKSVPVVSLSVAIPEKIAGKALELVGTDIAELDGKIESELSKFDSGILTPAIEAVVKIIIDVAGKSEEKIKPILETLLKPLGFLIKSELNEVTPDAHTDTPEVTVSE